MHRLIRVALTAGILSLPACAGTAQLPDADALRRQVEESERAFARSMAERDFEAFQSFLSDEAVFFSRSGPDRGKQAVAESWKPLFEEARAPFSWAPEQVQVLDSGTLALSSGPVHDADGTRIGTFTSIWRLESPRTWRIIFDKGCGL